MKVYWRPSGSGFQGAFKGVLVHVQYFGCWNYLDPRAPDASLLHGKTCRRGLHHGSASAAPTIRSTPPKIAGIPRMIIRIRKA